MQLNFHTNGPLNSEFLLCRLPQFLRCKIVLKSHAGNEVLPEYREMIEEFALRYAHEDENLHINHEITFLSGNLVLILIIPEDSTIYPKTAPTCDSTAKYRITLLKVALFYNKSENTCDVEPLENHLLPVCERQHIWKHFSDLTQYGDDPLFPSFKFGELTLEGSNLDDFMESCKCCTFTQDSQDGSNNPGALTIESDIFIHKIWGCSETTRMYERNMLKYDEWQKYLKCSTLTHKAITLAGNFLEYIRSDCMYFPSSFGTIGYSNVESDSDFSGYSNDEADCSSSPFGDPEFKKVLDRISETISDLGGEVIPSICGTFFDDGMWILNKTIVCHDARDLILLLKASTSWHLSIDDANTQKLILYKARAFRNSLQFRVYIYDSRIVAVSPLFLNQVFDFLSSDSKCIEVLDLIVDFYRSHVKEPLCDTLRIFKAVFDVLIYTKTEKVKLLSLSPWGEGAGSEPPLFSWKDIHEFAVSRSCSTFGDCADGHRNIIINGVLFVLLTSKSQSSRHNQHSWCPKDIAALAQSNLFISKDDQKKDVEDIVEMMRGVSDGFQS